MSIRHATLGACLGLFGGAAALLAASFDADAGPRARGAARTSVNHGGGAHAGAANRGTHAANVDRSAASNRTANVNRNTSVNRNTNVNRNTSIDVHNDIDIDVDDHWHNDWYDDHPVATAAAVTGAVALTAAAVGSIVNTVPPSCVTTVVNGIAYQQCGSTWYQPQYAGTQVQYVVVNPPN